MGRLNVVLADEVVADLRAICRRDKLSISNFAQNAIVRALRSYRSPRDFIAEGREKKEREPLATMLDPKMYTRWGTPLATDWPEKGFRDFWNIVRDPRLDIDRVRSEQGCPPITDDEYAAVVEYIGYPPGTKKGRGEQLPDD